MKLAQCQVPSNAQSFRIEEIRALGLPWVQFGDQLLLCSDDAQWYNLVAYATRVQLDLETYPHAVKEQDLYLVVQKGRLFQLKNPTVPVVMDKGRFLVVELDHTQAEKFATDEPCYVVQPLPQNQVIFAAQPPLEEKKEPEAWIDNLVKGVTNSSFSATLIQLVSYPTRYSTSDYYRQAAHWAQEQLTANGYTTSIEEFSWNDSHSWNVIADKLGHGAENRQLVLIVAHLDSINFRGDTTALAPGADDNGSGSAGLLEIARIFQNHQGINDLRLVLFGGEEQGLHGSKHYVANLSAAQRSRLAAIINMDMIASLNNDSPTVLLEGAQVSQSLIDSLVEAAHTYTSLTVQTSLSPYASDHIPFINAELPAVLTIEGADSANRHIHTADDTLEHINYELALEILRMNIAAVAAYLGHNGGSKMPAEKIPDPSNIPDGWKYWRSSFSGRYTYNGGASLSNARSAAQASATLVPSVLNNPIYPLNEPIYIPDWGKHPHAVRFTLNVDIDGIDPLGVVSGTVASGQTNPTHFIGRITTDNIIALSRNIVVEDLSFIWSDSSYTIDKLEINLTAAIFFPPTAQVTFISTATGRRFGSYLAQQASTYFQEVEIDVDREDGAIAVESYNTHTHPDRPADLPEENLTLATAFAKAGILIKPAPGSGSVIDTSEAGDNLRWNEQELHDSMEIHWDAFANQPQWKMWVFLAELADSDTLGGIMFDAYMGEPGGVDRQGTAVFTRSAFFHSPEGEYPQANPPAAQAAQRELFFNLIHETGHAFNLAHSFQKALGSPWNAPAWMPIVDNPEALSWMNYPETPSPGLNATWFYERFRFRFDDNENLFLRHAPESFVQMGNEAWFENHGRTSRGSLDHRLQLVIRSRKQMLELGEPVFVELRLRNHSQNPVMVHEHLHPSDGLVEIAVTNPQGERRPFIPMTHTRCYLQPQVLNGGESVYTSVNLTAGRFGFPFKIPGAYRIEVSYTNLDGGTAAAVMQLYVRPPANYEDLRVINELFNARMGRTLAVGGTRVMEDVNAKLDWMLENLSPQHPARYYLSAVRFSPLAQPFKVVDVGQQNRKLQVLPSDPALVQQELAPLINNAQAASDTVGHIEYRKLVDTYTQCAQNAGKKAEALQAQKMLLELFEQRNIVPQVMSEIEQKVEELQ